MFRKQSNSTGEMAKTATILRLTRRGFPLASFQYKTVCCASIMQAPKMRDRVYVQRVPLAQ
jgi:hypothetical protein